MKNPQERVISRLESSLASRPDGFVVNIDKKDFYKVGFVSLENYLTENGYCLNYLNIVEEVAVLGGHRRNLNV